MFDVAMPFHAQNERIQVQISKDTLRSIVLPRFGIFQQLFRNVIQQIRQCRLYKHIISHIRLLRKQSLDSFYHRFNLSKTL